MTTGSATTSEPAPDVPSPVDPKRGNSQSRKSEADVHPPRPLLRRVFWQPGFMASVVTVPAIAISTLWYVPALVLISGRNDFLHQDLVENVLKRGFGPPVIAPAVVTSWMVLAVSSRWRPEAS